MEQNQYPVEQNEYEPVPVGLQVCALILGVAGFAMALITFLATPFGSIQPFAEALQMGYAMPDISTFTIIAAVLSAIALILGIVGLVRSIRRPRTVKGIVFSAIGLNCGFSGLCLMLESLILSGQLSAFSSMLTENMH